MRNTTITRFAALCALVGLIAVASGCNEYSRDQAASDARATCSTHGGVARFEWDGGSGLTALMGEAEATCHDGWFGVFP